MLPRSTPPSRFVPRLFPLMLIAVLSLSACQSSEEKAEDHYQSALRLLAANDEDRAIVEFRNVFQLNGFHKEARQDYAALMLKRGQINEAYGQYLRLIEQYPDTLDARQTLAELAVARNDWDEVGRHGEAAIALAPDDPRNQTIATILTYQKAVVARDADATKAAVDRARSLLQTRPDDIILRRIVLDSLVSSGDAAAALAEVDRLLEQDKDSLEFNSVRLRLLHELDDQPGVGKQLRRLLELTPDNQDLRRAILQWHMSQQDMDGAEAFLREQAGSDTGPVDGHVGVVQFLKEIRGNESALAELDRLIAVVGTAPESLTYRALRAALIFETGQQDEALAQFAEIFSGTTEDTAQLRDIRVTYARALDAKGDRPAASAEIERILTGDPSNIEALKIRARWKIADDKPGEAIIDLRTALNQNARDPGILPLMAEAHLREGAPELAGERLALAVEASGARAEESLRYAQFLMQQNRPEVASRVLIDARRVAPGDLRLLTALIEVLIAMKDWPRAEAALADMAQFTGDEARTTEERIRTALALAQDRTGDALDMMQNMVESGNADVSIVAATVQTQIRSGKIDEARAFLDTELEKTPDNPDLRMLSANLDFMRGDVAAAESGLTDLTTEMPELEAPVRMLCQLLESSGRSEEAMAILNAGLNRMPESAILLWIKAGKLERAGDIDGAVGIYEQLYAKDSGNQIVANNLASLITTHRTDAADLERAYAIARRLRGSQVPAFQDTYGWIEFRRGNIEDALTYLEPAARGLPQDPLAQFHLGMAYAALGRTDQAKATLEAALTLAGDSPLAQFAQARETLATLGTVAPGTPVLPPGLTAGGSGGN